MINQETIQRILDATHIEEVVGEFVSLRKRGSNYIACCPFHDEKTPSFSISPAKNIYKCFGCGKAGDSVRFLMDHDHLTYPDALRYLARKYNITIEEEKLTEEQQEKKNERDALFHLSEFAQQYFADKLFNDEMGSAIGLSYFHQRGMSDEIIKSFGLGFCLDEWDDFTKHARQQGYSDSVLEKTGLTIFKEDGKCYDRFRGRVMFPIYTISGRVQGFSGRILSSDKTKAKYVNSPESEIYLKKNSLYGIYQAKSSIVKADKCYLVEGNIDVVSMHQSGVTNTVASCGTSLTELQARMIARFSKNVTVVYDGDAAGIKATLRAVNILLEEGMHVRMVLFPDGDDPDSYAQKYGSSALQEYLKSHEENFVLYKTRVLADEVKGDPIKKAQTLTEIVQTIALVPDMLERTEYVRLCSSILNMSEHTLQTELAKALSTRARKQYEQQHPSETNTSSISTAPAPTVTTSGLVVDANGKVKAGGNAPVDPTNPTDDEPPFDGEPGVPSSPSPSAQNTTQAPIIPSVQPDEIQERKIIELLLNQGSTVMDYPVKDQDGNITNETYFVAAVIVSELTTDEVTFDNPIYQNIFNDFANHLNNGELVNMDDYTNNPDETIRSLAAELLLNDTQISPLWEKKNIHTPLPEQRISQDVLYAIRTLKLRKLDRKINANSRQMTLNNTDEEMKFLLQEKMHLVRLRWELCAQMKCVVK